MMVRGHLKKMIYGLTIVSSATDIYTEDIHGKKYYRESFTHLFTSLKSLKDFALRQTELYFNGCDFEDEKDDNGQTLKDFLDSVKNLETICIQDHDSHIEFDFFKQEMTI